MTVKHSIPTLVLAALALLTPSTWAQSGGGYTVNTAVPFLLISPGARTSGFGEAGVAVANDASATYWNPAGLGFQKGQEVSLSHSNWLPQFNQSDLFYEYANYKINIPEISGTLGAALTFLNLGEFEARDETNTPLGKFKSFEMAFSVSYGARLDEDLSLGLGLRLIHSSLSQVSVTRELGAGNATTVAGDVGVLYKPSKFDLFGAELGNSFSLGASITNIGPSISYIDKAQADPLPTIFRMGFAVNLVNEEYNKLTWVADFGKLIASRTGKEADGFFTSVGKSFDLPLNALISSFTLGTGLEYWYSDQFALRAGFFHEDPDRGNRRFLTFGAGIRYDIYGFDFSYLSTDISSEKSPLSDTLRFTLSVVWDREGVPSDDTKPVPVDDTQN